MLNEPVSPPADAPRGHRIRELVCGYRPLRDGDGRIVDVPTVVLKDPRTAASVLAPLIAVSLVPILVSAVLALHAGDLVLISLLNALVSGGDAIAAGLVLLQVPANAVVQRRGECVIWRSLAA